MSKARDLANLFSGGVPAFSGTEAIDVPSGTTAQRPSNANTGYVRFNTTLDQLEQFTDDSGWQGISAPPSITSTDVNNVEVSDTTQTIVITGQNFDTAATASLVDGNGVTLTPTTSVRNSSSQITITLTGGDRLDENTPEPLDVKVINGSGLTAVLEDSIAVDDPPTWSTASGSLGTVFEDDAMSTIQLSATDPEGGAVSFAVSSGALPTGVSLSSGGAITGTPNVSDTYNASGVTHNFSVNASDPDSNVTNRSFSILRKWNDGSTSALAAPSSDALYQLGLSSGIYYIDRGTGKGAFQCYVQMLKNTGWAMVWNLNAHGPVNSTFYGYNQPNFWKNSGNYTGSPTTNTSPYADHYKSAAHDKYDDVSQILIVAHDAGSPSFDNLNRVNEGSNFGDSFAQYTVNSNNNTKTINEMMGTTNNVITSTAPTRGGGVVGFDYGTNRLGGEPFIDGGRRIVFDLQKSNTLGATSGDPNINKAFFGTDESATDAQINHNGHVLYGGFGGYHIRAGSYGLQFTAAANLGYHPGTYGLGLSYQNTTGSDTVWANNSTPASVQMVDFAIYVK